MNSKGEWGHCKIPRVIIEVGDALEEDGESGMSRSTEMGGKERRRGGIKIKKQEKRNQGRESDGRGAEKRPRLEEVRVVEETRKNPKFDQNPLRIECDISS